jgi:hypothetical protein
MYWKEFVQKRHVKVLDVVALLEDKPEEKLVSGQVGRVIEILNPGFFEVEFLDSTGRTITLAELKPEELIVLKPRDLARLMFP